MRDGFWHPDDVMAAPSVQKTFGAPQTWLCLFRTDSFGEFPMRAVPISWIPSPRAGLLW